MSSSNGVAPNEGPFQLQQIEGDTKRGGTWRLSFPLGQMVFVGWEKALEWLDREVRMQRVSEDALILAGPYSVPWLMIEYLSAADAAQDNSREEVFGFYATSAKALLETDSKYREVLLSPWVSERKQRAS